MNDCPSNSNNVSPCKLSGIDHPLETSTNVSKADIINTSKSFLLFPSFRDELSQLFDYSDIIIAQSFRRDREYTVDDPEFMSKQSDVTSYMRSILIDWLIDVHYRMDLSVDSLLLTINFIDRYLNLNPTLHRSKLQLVGVSAFSLACKIDEAPVPYDALSGMTERSSSKEEIKNTEIEIANFLEFKLNPPLITSYLAYSRLVCGWSETQLMMATYLSELTLPIASMSRHPPSSIAAAVTYLTNRIFKVKDTWPDALKDFFEGGMESNMKVIIQPYLHEINSVNNQRFQHDNEQTKDDSIHKIPFQNALELKSDNFNTIQNNNQDKSSTVFPPLYIPSVIKFVPPPPPRFPVRTSVSTLKSIAREIVAIADSPSGSVGLTAVRQKYSCDKYHRVAKMIYSGSSSNSHQVASKATTKLHKPSAPIQQSPQSVPIMNHALADACALPPTLLSRSGPAPTPDSFKGSSLPSPAAAQSQTDKISLSVPLPLEIGVPNSSSQINSTVYPTTNNMKVYNQHFSLDPEEMAHCNHDPDQVSQTNTVANLKHTTRHHHIPFPMPSALENSSPFNELSAKYIGIRPVKAGCALVERKVNAANIPTIAASASQSGLLPSPSKRPYFPEESHLDINSSAMGAKRKRPSFETIQTSSVE